MAARIRGLDRRARRAGPAPGAQAPLPMLTPFQARSVRLANRIVVSPMAMYSCVDGVPGEFHLVHLGRARWAARGWSWWR
ncbi:bifunctional hydroxylase/oxidoreductase [Bordetella pertussis]|nr:bifunctional hydroxylase/oxidoreductase [Bordetella pertussis]